MNRRSVRFARPSKVSPVLFPRSQQPIATSTTDILLTYPRRSLRRRSSSGNVKRNSLKSSVALCSIKSSKSCSSSESKTTSKVCSRTRVTRGSAVHWNKIYLDRPEVLKDKAKKLVAELDKKHIKLNERAIERIICGDAKEYLRLLKRLLNAFSPALKTKECETPCKTASVAELLHKLDEHTLKEATGALFSILTQILNYKPSISPVQFMQTRFPIQKLTLCLDVMSQLSQRPW